MGDERNGNLGPLAENLETRMQNLETTGGAARTEGPGTGAGNMEPGIKNLEVGGTTAAAPPPAPLSEAKPSVVDPFFSGRKHFPELDGLRGLAILLVIFGHYRDQFPAFGWLGGVMRHVFGWGWIGVDLFFVLSGFLITGILYDAKGQEHYFRNFYARRFLRIFPLYYSFLAALLLGLAAFEFLWPASYDHSLAAHKLWALQMWLWSYTFNIRSAIAYNSVVTSVSHLWSLSVEEQFYLFWPLVILLVPSRRLTRVCVAILVISPILRLAASAAGLSGWAIYTLTPFRLDGFACGALLAVYLKAGGSLAGNTGGLLRMSGILGIITMAAAFLLKHRWPWIEDLRYSALALLFTWVLSLAVAPKGTPVGRLCAAAPLRWLGKYSYGIYVFHLPILQGSKAVFGAVGLLGTIYSHKALCVLFATFNITIALLAAYLSYHLYEKHFLKLKKYFPEKTAASI